MTHGTVHQVNVSRGGVPKRPLLEGRVTLTGIEGDRQAQRHIHGGPLRAVCLFPLEQIERLVADGHPIAPGAIGENVTTQGVDWSRVEPGARLRLGPDVTLEVTAFTDPCKTIALAFSDGDFNRVNQRVAPGHSRVYARVLVEGTIRPGDPIELLPAAEDRGNGAQQEWSATVPVRDLQRAVAFYRDRVGARLVERAQEAGFALFELGRTRLVLDASDAGGAAAITGGSWVYCAVDDIERWHREIEARGVPFDLPPRLRLERDGMQQWIAALHDPDGNRLALVSEVPVPESA